MNRLRRIALLMLIVVGLSNNVTGVTTARFTSSAASGGTTISAGTLILSKTAPAAAVFTVTGLYPGQSTSAVSVTLRNDGTVPLKYSMATSVSSGSTSLASALDLTIKDGSCTGTTIYSGKLDVASFSLRPTTPVAANGTDTLCFQATLPSSAANSLQSASVDVTFTFTAEQA